MGEARKRNFGRKSRRTTIRPVRIIAFTVLALALVACASPAVPAGSPATAQTTGYTDPDTSAGQAGQAKPTETEQECPQLSPHPVAANIAETFEVEYEEVVEWFCGGQTFDEILLALQTAELAEVEVEVLFKARADGTSWDQIWNELGVTAP